MSARRESQGFGLGFNTQRPHKQLAMLYPCSASTAFQRAAQPLRFRLPARCHGCSQASLHPCSEARTKALPFSMDKASALHLCAPYPPVCPVCALPVCPLPTCASNPPVCPVCPYLCVPYTSVSPTDLCAPYTYVFPLPLSASYPPVCPLPVCPLPTCVPCVPPTCAPPTHLCLVDNDILPVELT